MEIFSSPQWANGDSVSRRNLFKTGMGVAAGLLTASPALAESGLSQSERLSDTRAFDTAHEVKPLPFDPANLRGLSKRLIESHWSNNYGGSVRALNETNRRLTTALADSEMSAFIYNDIKREHLMRTGSVVLHELYFENLGGDGNAASSVRSLLGRAFGSFDRWETEFRRIAAGLGGGSGWVLFGYNHMFGTLENYWMADHMHAPVNTTPILVVDMYEHSYHMDFGAATSRYVDAFFQNVNWDAVEARIEALT